jgi:hypothetical protein
VAVDIPSVPEGCFNLQEAYQYYLGVLLPDAHPTELQQEEIQSELVAAFQSKSVDVLFRRSGSDTIDKFPPTNWEEDSWPNRIFLSPQYQPSLASSAYYGCMPFVRSEAFRRWVDIRIAERAEHHALISPHWNFTQAIIWIMGQDDPKEPILWSHSTASAWMSNGSGFKEARRRLLLSLRDPSSGLIATGRRNFGGRVEMKPADWEDTHLELEPIGKELAFYARRPSLNSETGIAEAVTFHSLLVPRDTVMQQWPRPPHPVITANLTLPTEDELRSQGPWIFLGQAIVWIICRGGLREPFSIAEGWENAERQLFDALSSGDFAAEGYSSSRIEEPLPRGIWTRMNRGDPADPWFTPIDNVEMREDGGTVTVGGQTWNGVRMPAQAVFDRWPGVAGRIPSVGVAPEKSDGNAEEIIEAIDDPKGPDPEGAEQYLRRMDELFLADKGPRMKHREWLEFADKKFGVKNPTARKIYGTMSEGFRSEPGRPKANHVAATEGRNAS